MCTDQICSPRSADVSKAEERQLPWYLGFYRVFRCLVLRDFEIGRPFVLVPFCVEGLDRIRVAIIHRKESLGAEAPSGRP